MESIRIVFAIATIEDFKVHQVDVKIAFLNGDISIYIYRQQLEGFMVNDKENMVCRVTVCLSVSKMIKVLQSFGILKYHNILKHFHQPFHLYIQIA
jgi:hypothetical protein